MTTALKLYSTNTNDTLVTTARKLVTGTGATSTNHFDSKCGTSTGYSEMYSQGTTGAWAAAGSIGAFSDHGFIWDDTTLEGQQLISGNYTPRVRAIVSVGTLTVDMYVRAYVRSSGGTKTQIGSTMSKTGVTITTTSTNFDFAAASLPAQNFNTGDKFGWDIWFNITSNSTGSSAATVGIVMAISTTAGHLSSCTLDTPGYSPQAGGGATVAGTLPGQYIKNGISNFLYGTQQTPDYGNPNTVVNTLAIQNQIKAARLTIMRMPVSDGATAYTDAQIDQRLKACAASGCVPLIIIGHDAGQTFANHVVSYVGSRCLLYEFYNEPDLNVNIPGGWSEYLADWNAWIPTLRGLNPSAAFGGPALGVVANFASYLQPWLAGTVTSGILPDFVSFHDYPCGTQPSSSVCATKAQNIGNDAASLRSILVTVLGSTNGNAMPIGVTEWNIDWHNPPVSYANQANSANESFIDTWYTNALNGMAQNGVALACQFDAGDGAEGGQADLVSTNSPYPVQAGYKAMADAVTAFLGTTSTGGGVLSSQPYGITIGSRSPDSTLNHQAIVDMQNLGVTWLRHQVPWSVIDATGTTNQDTTTYHWNLWDSVVSQCNAASINVILTVMQAPAQFQTGSNPLAPGFTATFAAQVATRYDGNHGHGQLQGIELGNEDYNSGADVTTIPVPIAQALVATMKTCYPAIKAVDSTILVGTACKLQRNTAGYTAFFDTLLNPTTGAYIGGVFQGDYLNFHYYTCIPSSGGLPVSLDPTVDIPTWNNGAGLPSVTHAWKLVQAKMQQYNVKPAQGIWMTESGFQINSNPGRNSACNVSQATAWTYHQDVLDSLRLSGIVQKWFGFTLGYYDGYPSPNYRDGMSLVQGTLASPTYTTAYNNLKTYTAQYPTWGPSTTGAGTVTVSPVGLTFNGTLSAPDPASQTVTLTNSDSSIANYSTASSATWLSVSPTSGTIAASGGTQSSSVSVKIGALLAGTYSGTITYTTATGSATLAVTLVVAAVPPTPTPTPPPVAPPALPPSATATGTYAVYIGGNAVFVEAGTLDIEMNVGRRSQASFTVLSDTSTHYEQYEQVQIYDQNGSLVFSGYITEPHEHKPGFQPYLEHDITCTDQHFLADKRIVAASYVNKTCGFIVQDIVNNILSQEGVTVGEIYDGLTPSTTLFPGNGLFPGGNVGLVPSATFVYSKVSEALDALVTEASASGVPYFWMIDQFQQLWFVPYGTLRYNPNPGYAGTVLNDSPLGYYRLGEASGSVAYDGTIHSYDGAITGGVTEGVAGAIQLDSDTAMTFNGTTGSIVLPSGISLDGTAAFSVEGWIKPSNTVIGSTYFVPHIFGSTLTLYSSFPQYGRMVASDYVNGNKKGFQFGMQPGAAGLFFSIGDGVSMYEVLSPGAISTVSYTHVVGVWNGSVMYIYVNGVLIASRAAAITLGNATYNINIGRNPAGSDYFPGTIDEVSIYNYALSSTQVANHYNQGVTSVASSSVIDGSQIDHRYNPPTVSRANPKYRNTQYAIGGTQQTVQQVETRQGDGNTQAWTMGYELSTVPTVSVNLGNGSGGYLGYSAKNVGIKGVDVSKDFYWSKGDPTITQDSSGTKLRGTPYNDLLQVVYYGQYPSTFVASNQAQIAYQQNLDSSSGVVEDVIVDSTISDAPTGLSEVSSALTLYGQQAEILEFSTLTAGLAPGQLAPVLLPDFGINEIQDMLIESVTASDRQDGFNIWYRPKAMLGPYDTTWVAFFSSLLTTVQQANSINIGVSQTLSLLASFTADVTVAAALNVSVFACPIPNTTLNPSLTLYPC